MKKTYTFNQVKKYMEIYSELKVSWKILLSKRLPESKRFSDFEIDISIDALDRAKELPQEFKDDSDISNLLSAYSSRLEKVVEYRK